MADHRMTTSHQYFVLVKKANWVWGSSRWVVTSPSALHGAVVRNDAVDVQGSGCLSHKAMLEISLEKACMCSWSGVNSQPLWTDVVSATLQSLCPCHGNCSYTEHTSTALSAQACISSPVGFGHCSLIPVDIKLATQSTCSKDDVSQAGP